jgi:hypothetical protein
MYRFTSDTQLIRDITKEPIWANTEAGTPWTLFKRYAARQFNFIRVEAGKELLHGNPFPLFRLAVGGALGGIISYEAKGLLKKIISGQDYDDRDMATWQRVVNTYAASGYLGFLSDVFRTYEKEPKKQVLDYLGNIGRAVSPMPLAEGIGIFDSWRNIKRSKNTTNQVGKEALKQSPILRMFLGQSNSNNKLNVRLNSNRR